MERTLRLRIEADDWQGLINRFKSDLERAITEAVPKQVETEAEGEPKGRRGGGGGGLFGGVMVNIEKWLGEKSPILLSLFAIGGILSQISKFVMKLAEMGGQFSGHFQAAMKLLNFAIGMLFKPIADAIGMVMTPVLLFLLKYVILPFDRIVLKWFKEPWDKKIANAIMGFIEHLPPIMVAEKIAKFFGVDTEKLKEAIKEKIVEMLDSLAEKWQGFVDTIMNLDKLWTKLKNKWDEWVDGLSLSTLWDKLKGAWDDIVKTVADGKDAIASLVGRAWSDIVKEVTDRKDSIASSVGSAFDTIVKGIKKWMREHGLGWLIDWGGEEEEGKPPTYYFGGGSVSSGAKAPPIIIPKEFMPKIPPPIIEYVPREETFWERKGHLLMQTGGIIPETGLYVMHKGEKVIPSWKNAEGGHTFNIYLSLNIERVESEVDLDRLKNEIAEMIVDEIMRRGSM